MRIKILLFCLLLFAGIGIFFLTRPTPLPSLPEEFNTGILNERSVENSPENPMDRTEYLNRMLVSPATGFIPADMRSRELAFAKKHKELQESGPGFRTLEIGNWNERGPVNVGGRTRAVVIDANDEDRLIAGAASGGVWLSEQGGSSWARLTVPEDLHSVTCMVQDTRPGKTDIWYYGTGELVGNTARSGPAPFRGDGLRRSPDNGLTWRKLNATTSDKPHQFDNQYNYVWNVALDPVDQAKDVIYAAIFGAIARSIDAINWSIVLGPDFGFGGDINQEVGSFHSDVAVTSDGVVYATLSEFSNSPNNESSPDKGIYRSINQGSTWQKITPPGWPLKYRRTVIGISPSNPRIVYFLVDKGDDNGGEIWKLTDDPITPVWEDRSENMPNFGGSVGDYDAQNSYNMVIKVHPDNPDIVFIGATNLYRSTDGFTSSTQTKWIGGYDPVNDNSVYSGHHPDQHGLQFYPSNPNKALSSHDGGLSVTENILADSVVWMKINNRYITSQFYTIGMDESGTNDILLGGMQDNGTYITLSDNASIPWSRVIGGDGAYTAISRDGFFYYVSFQNSQIFRLTFDDEFKLSSFARVDPIGGGNTEDQEYLFINPYVLDPNNSNIMYLAGGDVIWRNQNLSQIPRGSNDPTYINWKRLFPQTKIGDGVITALDVSTQPKDILYYGTSMRRLFRLDNAASPDFQLSELTDLANFPSNGYISSISVDPSNADNIMVSFSNYEVQSIFYSSDGGESFQAVSGDLEEFPDGSGNGPSVRWVQIIPMQNNEYAYLAATSTGLYSTQEMDGLNTQWIQESPDEIGNKVVTMVKYRSTDGRVIAATHGSGVYETTLNGTLPIEKDFGELKLSVGTPYPNPFEDVVNIPCNIPENNLISVEILNTLGQSVKTLFLGSQLSGSNILTWDGTNNAGAPVPDGVYICALFYNDRKTGKRIILTRR